MKLQQKDTPPRSFLAFLFGLSTLCTLALMFLMPWEAVTPAPEPSLERDTLLLKEGENILKRESHSAPPVPQRPEINKPQISSTPFHTSFPENNITNTSIPVTDTQSKQGTPHSANSNNTLSPFISKDSVEILNTPVSDTPLIQTPLSNPEGAGNLQKSNEKLPVPLSFELVRVEPTGESILSGKAPQGDIIQLVINNRILSTVGADQTGVFVVTLPSFSTGGHNIELRAVDKGGNITASTKAMVVLIKEPEKNETQKEKKETSSISKKADQNSDRHNKNFKPGDSVTVFEGENLWAIAKRVYGSGTRYKELYGANQKRIRNPHIIYPGQILIIPHDANSAHSN